MHSETINKIADASVAKSNLLKKGLHKYILQSALAGAYVGLSMILIFTVGGYLHAANSPTTKIVMGLSFGVALSLVMLCGADLFTGNNLVMTVGLLEKKVNFKEASNIWIVSWIGNFLGAAVIAGLYIASGLAHGFIGEFMIEMAHAKFDPAAGQIFVRGILCNILVCLAVWGYYKLKEETAKLIVIFWCLYAFITSGFEHSVANMTVGSLGMMLSSTVTPALFAKNLIFASLGNFVGGALFVALPYWLISREK